MRRKYQEYQDIWQDCEIIVNYFKRSGQVIQNLLNLTEMFEGFYPAHIMECPYMHLIQQMPLTFE